MVKNEGDRLERVLVCSPMTEYFSVDSAEKHNIFEIADMATAVKQHEALKNTIKNFGAKIINIEEMPGHPNSVFTRDMAISTPHGYIKPRMGIRTRRGEEDWIAKFLDDMGVSCVGRIEEPGTVEGGDVVIAGHVAFVGLTQRTNFDGVIQISELLEKMEYEVRPIVLPSFCLHLDQVLGILGPEMIICCTHLFTDDYFKGFEVIHVACRNHNVNLICLGESEIIAPAENPELIHITRQAGIHVHEVELSEFAKGAGGPNCLILPIKRG
ncbi:MAG: amidinotransferase [Candidatus Aminicenantes bacterium]|nr:amidinotransferase [Candidatus Aminicenantes bacterium]